MGVTPPIQVQYLPLSADTGVRVNDNPVILVRHRKHGNVAKNWYDTEN